MQQVLIVKSDAEHNIDATLARLEELLKQANAVSLNKSALSGRTNGRS